MQENGLVAIVKRDCPTCVMVAPVLQEILQRNDLNVNGGVKLVQRAT